MAFVASQFKNEWLTFYLIVGKALWFMGRAAYGYMCYEVPTRVLGQVLSTGISCDVNLVPRVLSLLRESTLVAAGQVSARFLQIPKKELKGVAGQ